MTDSKTNVLLVGAGKMGLAMLKGWLAADHYEQFSFSVLELHPSEELLELKAQFDLSRFFLATKLSDLHETFEVVILAIKPQQFAVVLPDITPLSNEALVVSIAAGVPCATISDHMPTAKVVRVMPNLPAQVGAGMSGAFTPYQLTEKQDRAAGFLLGAAGAFKWVDDESQIDAVTAISGSGPAYVFLLAEALAKVAEQIGLDPRNVETFANQTIIGAAELLKQSEEGAATLRRNVTSPGGTTEAALNVLMREGNGLEDLLLEAVQAAKKRSEELSK